MLHASDLHIDNTAEGSKGFMQLIDAAVELDVDVLVLVGDTFDDNRANPATLAMFVEHLARLRVPIVVLPGNHDPFMNGSAYERMELPDHVIVLTDPDGSSVELPASGSSCGVGRTFPSPIADRSVEYHRGAHSRGRWRSPTAIWCGTPTTIIAPT